MHFPAVSGKGFSREPYGRDRAFVEGDGLPCDGSAHFADDGDGRVAGFHKNGIDSLGEEFCKGKGCQLRADVPAPQGLRHDEPAPMELTAFMPGGSRADDDAVQLGDPALGLHG